MKNKTLVMTFTLAILFIVTQNYAMKKQCFAFTKEIFKENHLNNERSLILKIYSCVNSNHKKPVHNQEENILTAINFLKNHPNKNNYSLNFDKMIGELKKFNNSKKIKLKIFEKSPTEKTLPKKIKRPSGKNLVNNPFLGFNNYNTSDQKIAELVLNSTCFNSYFKK